MSEANDILKRLDEHKPPGLSEVALVMQRMIIEDYIKNYAIGGAVAVAYYSEPLFTEDVDVFCYYSDALANNISPIRTRLEELGVVCRGMNYYIKGIKVQMQSMAEATPLEKKAFETAGLFDIDNVSVRIFQLEYAIAVKVQANRKKDWNHIFIAMDSADVNTDKLMSILREFGLLEAWRKNYEPR